MKQIFLLGVVLSLLLHATLNRTVNGTVTDSITQLEWQDDYNNTTNTLQDANWTDAINYCENLLLDGRSDWRLPDYNELLSLYEFNQGRPFLSTVFQAQNSTQTNYFSSTTHVDTPAFSGQGYAWSIEFNSVSGGIGTGHTAKNSHATVRCVRN